MDEQREKFLGKPLLSDLEANSKEATRSHSLKIVSLPWPAFIKSPEQVIEEFKDELIKRSDTSRMKGTPQEIRDKAWEGYLDFFRKCHESHAKPIHQALEGKHLELQVDDAKLMYTFLLD